MSLCEAPPPPNSAGTSALVRPSALRRSKAVSDSLRKRRTKRLPLEIGADEGEACSVHSAVVVGVVVSMSVMRIKVRKLPFCN